MSHHVKLLFWGFDILQENARGLDELNIDTLVVLAEGVPE